MMNTIRLYILVLATAVVALPAAAQTQVTLSPTKDNTLFESTSGNVSNGAGDHLFIGATARGPELRRALLAFDIASSVPAGATIDSVKLTMTMSKTISGAHDAMLHRVTQDWGEGTSDATGQEGAGGPAATGDATWIHTFFDTAVWSNAGGDFADTSSATASVAATGIYTWGSTSRMVGDVQAWLDDGANNFGWIVIGDEGSIASAKRFDSRESANPPQLQIFYSLSTAVEDTPEKPSQVALLDAYPNPFTESTTVEYTLADGRAVRLEVYDTLGRQVATLADGFHAPGTYKARFQAGNLPTGVYFVRVAVGGHSRYRQVVLIR